VTKRRLVEWVWARDFVRSYRAGTAPGSHEGDWSLSFVRWWYGNSWRVVAENQNPQCYAKTRKIAEKMLGASLGQAVYRALEAAIGEQPT